MTFGPIARLLLVVLLGLLPWSGAQAFWNKPAWQQTATAHIAGLPLEVRQTIVRVRQGGPFLYARDGIVFQNRENRLPPQPRGYYREYTVPTPGMRGRGSRRLIHGRSGEFFYTPDHYHTFWRVQE